MPPGMGTVAPTDGLDEVLKIGRGHTLLGTPQEGGGLAGT